MLIRRLRRGLPLVLLGILIASANAQDLVSARILSLDGAVEIQRRPEGRGPIVRVSLNANDEVRAGDVIVTQGGGRLVLGLSDGTQAVIGEKATVEIGDLAQSPRALFKIFRGKTRVKVEKVGGQPNPYRVNTPTAVIAVRGTIFDVLVSEGHTEVFTHEGQVAVSRLETPTDFVLLSAGLRTRVRLGRAPEIPSTFKPGRNDGFFNRRVRVQRSDRPQAASGPNRPGDGRRPPTATGPGGGAGRGPEGNDSARPGGSSPRGQGPAPRPRSSGRDRGRPQPSNNHSLVIE